MNYQEEIILCYHDFEYFCEKYVKIRIPQSNNHTTVVPFKLWPHQKRWANHVQNNRFTIHSHFRQGGFTTLSVAYGVWLCLFRLDQSVMYLTKSDRHAVEAGRIAKNILEDIPQEISGNVLKMSNDHMKKFETTGSHMYFYTPEAACGKQISLLIIDEASYIQDLDKHWKAMWPILSTGGSCIMMSTANSTRDFFWETKTKTAMWSVYECDVAEHPSYSPAWENEMIKQMGQKGWDCQMLQKALDPDAPPKETKKWRSIYDNWESFDFFKENTYNGPDEQ